MTFELPQKGKLRLKSEFLRTVKRQFYKTKTIPAQRAGTPSKSPQYLSKIFSFYNPKSIIFDGSNKLT